MIDLRQILKEEYEKNDTVHYGPQRIVATH